MTNDLPGSTPAARRVWRALSPHQLFATSFALLIALGTAGLRWVPAFYTSGEPLGWVDALFTATSAVCVTGLIVVDTATHFTVLGQAFVLLLIQVGGLGMITITTLILLQLGGRLSLRSEAIVPRSPGLTQRPDPRRVIRDIVLFTLTIEAIGAALLFWAFRTRFETGTALWHAVFQSVSAFCNAGFSTFTDSLEGWSGSGLVLWPIIALIVAGGIGFITLEELADRWKARSAQGPVRMSLHTRIVLLSSALLLAGGWVFFAFLEWEGVLGGMRTLERLQNALFMSVTARTAGFNTIPYAEATDATNFVTILLMSIGGSPGSTAGGLKTTTFFVIGLLAWSRMRGRTQVSIWSRTVPAETVQRAVGLFVVASGTVSVGILGYEVLEVNGSTGTAFLTMMFEAVSAFNTVGLSLGATGELGAPARLLTVLLMFLGRIGPLSFAAALALRARGARPRYRYAHEDVSIG